MTTAAAPPRQSSHGAVLPAGPVALHVPRWLVAAFGVAIVLTYFALLGGYSLAEPDEPRYAEIAREMIELRDWVTPHLDYVKYFEKPPFVYWLTAMNFELFGMSEFVVRLWPAIFALVGIGMAYGLGRAMYGAWTGYVAAALLAATPLYFGLSQIVILDMPLSALMAVGLGAFWFAYRAWANAPPLAPGGRRQLLVLLLSVATALGVLTKGPVAAVLTGGVIVVFLILRRDLAAIRWLLSPVPLLAFFALTVPWFVLVSRRNPEFIDFFIVDQHLKRFLAPNEHQQGLWFFVPIVWGGMLPWSGLMLFAPGLLRRSVVRVARARVSAATLFCVVWSAVVFLFFSLSGSKLATYVLPMFCPLAILAARFFRDVFEQGPGRFLTRGCLTLLCVAALTALGAAVAQTVADQWEIGLIVPHMYGGAAVLGVAALAALALVRRQAYPHSFAVLLAGVLALQLVAISGREVVPDYRDLGLAIRAQAQPQDAVMAYNHYVQGIPFYARRRTMSVRGHGELEFGSHHGDQRAFFLDNDEALLDVWQSPRHVFLVINRLELEPLLPRLHPAPRQIAAQGKKVVVVNFAG